jgi:hypothetical protein
MSVRIRSRNSVTGHLRVFVVLACGAFFAPAETASARADLRFHDSGTGAVAAYTACALQADGDYLCEDFIVQYFRSRSTGGGSVVLAHYKALIHPDGTATEFAPELGFADGVNGSHDSARLTFARMSGVTLSLNDIDRQTGIATPNGRTATLGPFEWVAASDIYVFANDGPFGFGLPRLFADGCATMIENAHERFTTARVTGTINGVSVDAYGPSYLPWPGTGPADALGAIFDLHINVLAASHGPGC